jgi:hypothetical protein
VEATQAAPVPKGSDVMSAATKLLDRLQRVKATGSNTWLASCPTTAHKHGDRSRGLSIREADDRVLIYCHAGCGAVDIVEALGLTLADLYDRPVEHRREASHSRIPARDLLEIISEEVSVVSIVTSDLLEQKAISDADWKRLATAAGRIFRARDHAYGR